MSYSLLCVKSKYDVFLFVQKLLTAAVDIILIVRSAVSFDSDRSILSNRSVVCVQNTELLASCQDLPHLKKDTI